MTREGVPLLHFSEDPHIEHFVPHVPATNPDHPPAVWAIDADHAPLYWFPRDCPRVTVWADDAEQLTALHERFTTTARRVHAAELGWLARNRAVELFVYELPPATFRPWEPAYGQWISEVPVEPLGVTRAGDLLRRHAAAGIELRLVPDLHPLREAVLGSGLPFSMVRVHHRHGADARRPPPGTLTT